MDQMVMVGQPGIRHVSLNLRFEGGADRALDLLDLAFLVLSEKAVDKLSIDPIDFKQSGFFAKIST